MRYWSIESALGNRQVVTRVDADDAQPDPPKLKDGWLIFRDRQSGEAVAAFSQRTLLSAVVLDGTEEPHPVVVERNRELLLKVHTLGIGGIFDAFTSIDDAIEQMVSYIKELDSREVDE